MGKKKDCFGLESHVCMVKVCPYMSECIRVVWEKKMEKVLSRARDRRAARADEPDEPAGKTRRHRPRARS